MIPLRDDNPTRRFAILTAILVIVNVAVFGFQISKPDDLSRDGQVAFACEFGIVPDQIVNAPDPPSDGCVEINQGRERFLSLITSQFLHGGWLHLAGNMLFLWVFANNIEDRLGRLRFVPFYLLCGAVAGIGQVIADPDSTIPVIGASGAISGMLGAYLVLFPRHRVLTIVMPFFFLPFRLPAWIWLGIYFLLQFLFLGGSSTVGGGGVAYWAHIGGFVAGAVLIRPFLAGRGEPPHASGAPAQSLAPGRW